MLRNLSIQSNIGIAEIVANEGIGTVLDNATVTFQIRELDGTVQPPVAVTKAIVTIDPIPQWRIIDVGGGRNVGYLELSTFISTADAEFDEVFAAFRSAGNNWLRLCSCIREYNADRAAQYNTIEIFDLLANSISLSRMVVIASRGTASASELVTNGLIPHVDVAIVGDRTFGKPVGQIGLDFCEKILRPTSFKLANSLGDGDYFDGLPVDCAATDDLNVAVGADADPNMVAAMSYLNTGACPVTSLPGSNFKAPNENRSAQPAKPRPPHRELLDAY